MTIEELLKNTSNNMEIFIQANDRRLYWNTDVKKFIVYSVASGRKYEGQSLDESLKVLGE
jgi:hypothetical protein